MLIKYKNKVININLISYFEKVWNMKDVDEAYPAISFDILGNERSNITFDFYSEEERDKAFDRILEDYRWQRLQCTLD